MRRLARIQGSHGVIDVVCFLGGAEDVCRDFNVSCLSTGGTTGSIMVTRQKDLCGLVSLSKAASVW